VHLEDGTPVIVKVQRPGVAAQVKRDLAVLAELAELAARRTPLGRYYDLPGMIEEFAFTSRNELDYTWTVLVRTGSSSMTRIVVLVGGCWPRCLP